MFLWTFLTAPCLSPLVCEADHSTQVLLRDYVISHVFEDLEEEENEDEDGKKSKCFLNHLTASV